MTGVTTGDRRPLHRVSKWMLWSVTAACVAVVVIGFAWAAMSRDLPDLQPWHTQAPEGELTAGDISDRMTLAEYLRREDLVMRDVRERIESQTEPAFQTR